MNPYFTMNPNDDDEERQPDSFDVDDESDVYFLQQAYEYHERLVVEENHPRLTHIPIHHDREGAEDRLMGDYFDEYSAVRQLTYGNTLDAFDEYLQMSERTARDWVPGANNDINILDSSSLFDDLIDDKSHVASFVVNGVGFENGYYLAHGIYPQWATFVKSFTVANDAKHSYFKKRQESARKDVERAFGVLQRRWGIIQQPTRQYHVNNIRRIMYSCIILHNMILEDQKMAVTEWNDAYANPSRNMQRTWVERCETQRRKTKELRDRETHISLQQNLMEHIWHEVEHEDEDEDFWSSGLTPNPSHSPLNNIFNEEKEEEDDDFTKEPDVPIIYTRRRPTNVE
ncbi:ALP1-like protein isoform X1, partial [Tanacetum coccineum]